MTLFVTAIAWLRQRPAVVFGGAAAALAPWIVVLALTQRPRGVAENITPLRVVLLVAIVGLSLVAVLSASARPRPAAMVASAAATLALGAAWFDIVTRWGLPSARLVDRLGIYSLVTLVADAVLAAACLRQRYGRRLVPRGLVVVAVAALTVQGTSVLTSDTPALTVTHVRAAWVGLDVAELVTLAALGVVVATRHELVALVGPATAALLTCDAVINVSTSGGVLSVAAALAMAVVELGLGALAMAVAARTPRASRHPAAPTAGRDGAHRPSSTRSRPTRTRPTRTRPARTRPTGT